MSVQKEIFAKYGAPGEDYNKKHCIVWKVSEDFPWFLKVKNTATDDPDDVVKSIYINKDFKDALYPCFKELESLGLHTEIEHYDGCYNPRTVRGMESASLHSWMLALDLNASKEKLAQTNTHWTPEFIAVVRKHHIFWGGDWHNRKDSMHFALYNG